MGIPDRQRSRRSSWRPSSSSCARCRACSNGSASPSTAFRCSPSDRSCRSSPPAARPRSMLAALAVFFTTMVCCVVGLRSADPASIDVVRAAGGGRRRSFVAVRVPAALPALFAGLRIAAPAALLGAIVGEYLGGRRGLGVAMIQSQSSFDVARTWGLAVVMGLTVGLVYAVTGVLARLLLPWAAGERPLAVLQLGAGRSSVASSAMSIAVSAAVLVAGWWGLLRLYDLNPYFAKTPGPRLDVPHHGQRRSQRDVVGVRHDGRRHRRRLHHRPRRRSRRVRRSRGLVGGQLGGHAECRGDAFDPDHRHDPVDRPDLRSRSRKR